MVKGVNKNIIEINDTGNKYFERVLFFVNPEHSHCDSEKLEKNAADFLNFISDDIPDLKVFKLHKKKSKTALAIAIGASVLAVAAVLYFVL